MAIFIILFYITRVLNDFFSHISIEIQKQSNGLIANDKESLATRFGLVLKKNSKKAFQERLGATYFQFAQAEAHYHGMLASQRSNHSARSALQVTS